MIKITLNIEGEPQTTPSGILRTFTQFFQTKYATINTDNENIARMARHIKTTVPPEASALFDTPISAEELHKTVQQAKANETPGYVGICHDI